MTDRPEDDDLTAAEYALGTLDSDERVAAARRRGEDAVFDGLVSAWEGRLAPLSEAGREAEPPAHLWNAILRQLGLAAGPLPGGVEPGTNVIVLHRAVRRWKQATAIVSALAACLALVVVVDALRPAQPGPNFIAFLQKTGDAPAYVVKASLSDHVLAVKPIDAKPPAGRSYELWIIDPTIGAPKSLGVPRSRGHETCSASGSLTRGDRAGDLCRDRRTGGRFTDRRADQRAHLRRPSRVEHLLSHGSASSARIEPLFSVARNEIPACPLQPESGHACRPVEKARIHPISRICRHDDALLCPV